MFFSSVYIARFMLCVLYFVYFVYFIDIHFVTVCDYRTEWKATYLLTYLLTYLKRQLSGQFRAFQSF